MMNSITGKFMLVLLLATGVGNVCARQHGGEWQAHREARQAQQGQHENRRFEQQQQQQQQQAPAFAPQEDPRRGGRMTPDERRELRRQINEAGRDLYAPRR